VFLIAIALIACLLVLAAAAQLVCARIDAGMFPPPGRMVGIPGSRMHLLRLGAGAPSIVLEAGIAASSLNWSVLQPALATSTTTYSYDRAGFGWSASDNSACTLAKLTDDLHALVAGAPVPAPFILVAHSFGSYIATVYARRFPNELAGVVLVDPLTPEEWIEPTPEQRSRLRRGTWFSRAGGVVASVGVLRACLWLLQRGDRERPRRVLRLFGTQATETVEHILSELAKLPPDVVRVIRARWSRPQFFWTMADYIRSLPDCAVEMNGCAIPCHIPVTVLSGAHQAPERMQEHAAIATHSERGRHIVAGASAHWVHLDQPELVVDAVREMVEAVQDRRDRATSPSSRVIG
jgi:pimeloyl-ACP methyl ester carboxylesterase